MNIILLISILATNIIAVLILIWRISVLEDDIVSMVLDAKAQHTEIMHLTRAVGAISLKIKDAVFPKDS